MRTSAENPAFPAWLISVGGETYGTGQALRREYRGPRSTRDPNAIPFDLTDRVLGFSVEQEEGKQDKVEIDIANPDLSFFASPVMVKGTDFNFSFGYSGNLAPGGLAKVQSIRGFQQLKVEAYAVALALTTEQKSRVWENVKRRDIVKKIAFEHGIRRTDIAGTNLVLTPGGTAGQPRTFVQSAITDWEFLLELAEPLGFSVWFTIEQGVRVLHWGPRKYGGFPSRVFAWNSTGSSQAEYRFGEVRLVSNVAPLLGFNIEENTQKGKPSKVEQTGYDPDEHQPLTSSGVPATEEESLGAVTEISDPEQSGGRYEKSVQLEPTAHANIAWLQEEAKGRNRWTQEDQIVAKATVPGDPSLTIGHLIEVQSVPKFLAGNWYVKGVKHSIASDGYKSTLKLTRNSVGDVPVGPARKVPAKGKVNANTAAGIDPEKLQAIRGRDIFGEKVIVYGRPLR